jgi:Ca-activated chloride channel homolog
MSSSPRRLQRRTSANNLVFTPSQNISSSSSSVGSYRQRRTSVTMNTSTFIQNLQSSQIPEESSIQSQGAFQEHFFDDKHKPQNDILYGSYSTMEITDPLTKEDEKYLLTSLNSTFDGKNHREPLNLIFVLDISGSMHSPMGDESTSKMEVANQILVQILKTLKQKETFGIVLFDNKVEVFQDLTQVNDSLDMNSIANRILKIVPRGSTNMEIGMSTALKMMKKQLNTNKNQNRIIFLTDACPNQGEDKKLIDLTEDASNNSIYTTYIGIGMDFDTGFVNELTRTQGTNYFGVASQREFEEILHTNFNYIVTPISFNTHLTLESDAYSIDKVYGTAFEEEFKDETVDLASQIAAQQNINGKRGNILLIKLKEKKSEKDSKEITMKLKFNTVNGKSVELPDTFDFDKTGNGAIDKAIWLMKYVKMSHKIIRDEISEDDFNSFISHLKKKSSEFKDDDLQKEIDLLQKLYSLQVDSKKTTQLE